MRIVVFFSSSKSARGAFHHPALWEAARLLVKRFLHCLPSEIVLLQGNEDVVSVQDFIFLYLCLV